MKLSHVGEKWSSPPSISGIQAWFDGCISDPVSSVTPERMNLHPRPPPVHVGSEKHAHNTRGLVSHQYDGDESHGRFSAPRLASIGAAWPRGSAISDVRSDTADANFSAKITPFPWEIHVWFVLGVFSSVFLTFLLARFLFSNFVLFLRVRVCRFFFCDHWQKI